MGSGSQRLAYKPDTWARYMGNNHAMRPVNPGFSQHAFGGKESVLGFSSPKVLVVGLGLWGEI
jgi:hypothetical protein